MEPVSPNITLSSNTVWSPDFTNRQVTLSTKAPSYFKRSAPTQKSNTADAPKHDLESADRGSDTSERPGSALAYMRSRVWARPLAAAAAVYLSLILMLIAMVKHLPTRDALSEKAQLPADTQLLLKLPRNVVELRAVRHTLELYRQNYSAQVAALLVTAYIVMQSLSIPGSIGINLLMGSMYSFPVAFITIALTSTAGACMNYSISWIFLKDIMHGLFSQAVVCTQRVSWFSRQIARRRDNILAYFIFLRISPFLPSWFINLASPIVGIPFRTFALGTFIGLQPLNFISVSTGRTLGRMQSMSDLYSIRTLLIMMMCALLALLPAAFKQLARRHPRLGCMPPRLPSNTTPALKDALCPQNSRLH